MKAEERARWAFAVAVALAGALAIGLTGHAAPVMPSAPGSGWLFDEGSGTTLSEWFGTGAGQLGGHTAVAPPSWTANTPFGYAGNSALQFVGTGVGVNSNWCRLDGEATGSTGTIAFWVTDDGQGKYMMDATNGHRTLMYRGGTGTTQDFGVYLNQSSLGNVSGTLVPDNGQWTHVAMTWDTSLPTDKQKIYQNGSLFATTNVAVAPRTPADFYLGSRFSLNEGWGGKMDEFAVWGQALTPDEIEWLGNNSINNIPIPPPPPARTPPPPVSRWLFDEGLGGDGAPTRDSFGTNHGTLRSNVGWTTNTPFSYAGNNAVYFDGTGANRVNFGPHNYGTEGSISVWVYRDNATGTQYVFDSSSGARTLLYGGWSLFLNNHHVGNMSSALIAMDQWTHLGITWDNAATDGMRQKVYQNGELFWFDNDILNPASPAMLWLGNRYSNNEPWKGALDEYALWDTALTPEQMRWLAQNSALSIPEPGTMALLGLGLVALVRRRRR
ncbi:LamG domain-containing protein [Planctomycetota bacterium]